MFPLSKVFPYCGFISIYTNLILKHGIKNIGYWTASIGDYSDRLIYIIAFVSMEHRARAWDAFSKDPEWAAIRGASESDGPLVSRIHNSILNPTDYSPLQ